MLILDDVLAGLKVDVPDKLDLFVKVLIEYDDDSTAVSLGRQLMGKLSPNSQIRIQSTLSADQSQGGQPPGGNPQQNYPQQQQQQSYQPQQQGYQASYQGYQPQQPGYQQQPSYDAADYPPLGYPPQQPTGYPPQGYPPQQSTGYPPQGYPPQQSTGYPPMGYPPFSYQPSQDDGESPTGCTVNVNVCVEQPFIPKLWSATR